MVCYMLGLLLFLLFDILKGVSSIFLFLNKIVKCAICSLLFLSIGILIDVFMIYWFRWQVLIIVIIDFRSSLFFSFTSIAFDPLRGYSQSWNLPPPYFLITIRNVDSFFLIKKRLWQKLIFCCFFCSLRPAFGLGRLGHP